jgi:hypothetical protein
MISKKLVTTILETVSISVQGSEKFNYNIHITYFVNNTYLSYIKVK